MSDAEYKRPSERKIIPVIGPKRLEEEAAVFFGAETPETRAETLGFQAAAVRTQAREP